MSYCVYCGEVSFGPSPPSKISRPTGVTILAVLAIIDSILILLVGLFFAGFFAFFLPGLGALILVFSFVVFLLEFVAAICLFTGRNWARILAMVVAVLELFSFPVGTIFAIVGLYYLTRPRVVAYFKQPK